MTGTTIAHYRVTAKLGQGGMGEVYRATDTKLDREVAIKVLPAVMATDKERLARFEREAKVLAQLSHANIATVHGFDHHEGTSFLVMEHVTGEDLSERLRRGALPVEEAIEIGQQIAEALEAAHARGIVHRDLKPANIKVTAEGHVKVLDFGLAKALEADSEVGRAYPQSTTAEGDGSRGRSPHLEDDSPTITDTFTKPGTILGTAAYMSPEQAKGKSVDGRTDIWAFGCVLFESLTGKRAFAGGDSTETLAAIIRGEPDWSLLPKDVSPLLRWLLTKCLTKDPRSRLQHIGDARLELTELASGSDFLIGTSEASAIGNQSAKPGAGLMWTGVGFTAVALIASTLAWVLKPVPTSQAPPVRKVSIDLGVDGGLFYEDESIRLSRDGKSMAFLFTETESRGGAKLFLRSFNRLQPEEIQGAQDVRDFCFSPDGNWIAFFSYSDERIHKVSLSGEESDVHLSEVHGRRISGMDWTDDGWILFGANGSEELRRIPEEGGDEQILFSRQTDSGTISLPHSLPDGGGWLFTVTDESDNEPAKKVMLQKAPNATPVILLDNAAAARFVRPGFLVFARDDMLFAQRFNLLTSQLEGQAVRLDVMMDPQSFFDVADDGTLVFTQPGRNWGRAQLAWLSRSGGRQAIQLGENGVGNFALSFDGNQIAYVEHESLTDSRNDLWLYEVETGNKRLLPSQDSKKGNLLWSPNDDWVIFGSEKDGAHHLFAIRADGSGQLQSLMESRYRLLAYSWHPTERKLLYATIDARGDRQDQLWVATFAGGENIEWTLVNNDFYADVSPRERGGASFSPDGKWIIYSSQEARQGHLFIDQYPNPSAPKKITFAGLDSYFPQWRPDQHELVFTRRETQGSRLHHIYVAKYRENGNSYDFDRPLRWNNGLVHRGVFGLDPMRPRLLVRQYGSLLNHVVLYENIIAVAEQKLSVQEE